MPSTIPPGVGVALVTLLHPDGRVDLDATAAHARRLVAAGVAFVLVAGTTGEAGTLGADERVALIEAVRGAGVPVMAGTGAATTEQSVAFTRDAVTAGADAVLAFAPPGSTDLVPFYGSVRAAAGGRPLLAYHIPSVSLPGVPAAALPTLDVDGIKDSSGDADRLRQEVAEFRGTIYVGAAALVGLAAELGCAGAILAVANIVPEQCVAAFAGDVEAQQLLASMRPPTGVPAPVWIKEEAAARYGTSARHRLQVPAA